jgi:hypothetical protein
MQLMNNCFETDKQVKIKGGKYLENLFKPEGKLENYAKQRID